jgi:hypothetical protein
MFVRVRNYFHPGGFKGLVNVGSVHPSGRRQTMKGFDRIVLLGAALVLAGGAARARPSKEPLYDQLVRECKLTEDQQATVKEKIKALDDALAAWDTENAEKVQAAKDAAKGARTKEDDEAKKKAAEQSRALRDARAEVAVEPTKAVFDILTKEQQQAWAGYELYQSIAGRYRRVEITEEQQAKIKAACAVAQEEIAAAEAEDDTKTAKDLVKRLRWGVEVFVLTDDQRGTMRAPKGGKTK